MTSTQPTNTYPDLEYEEAHIRTFTPRKDRPISLVLPPGINQETFEKAVEEFALAIGKDQVFVKEALAQYIDPYDLHDDDNSKRKVPSAAVCPGSMDELRAVLQTANKFGIPVWTFSRGKNLGYGGPAPRVNGSVALDLHRMDKVIEVNDKHAYAVVEPGVTFHDLYKYCVANKKKVWPSTPSLGWGSVVGNSLERGTGFGSNSNHNQSITGMEVMLADGDLVRTGQFGITNSPSAFLSKFTFGPSVEGLFLQSNLGIVTKLAIWLTPAPPAFMSCRLTMPEEDDIKTLIDAVGRMRRSGLIPNVVWVGNFIERLCIRGKRRDFWQGEGAIPAERLLELQKELKEDYWTASFGLYGPAKVIEAQFNEIKQQLEVQAPTGTVTGHLYAGSHGEPLDAASVPFEHGLYMVGIPSMFSLPLMDWALKDDATGKGAHGDYAPVIPHSGEKVLESRAHNDCQDLIAEHNDFNNHAYLRFVETLKDSVDPNGILSPGKQGIWPKKYRHLREGGANPKAP
ncbi:uncharacterized protein JN550_004677 [Neoarthrinium moseri]|uniref:uncharacterized protein n=1 Tax=Neoarthrinium moseri TaxID=1658444 RepID=UPI001FDB35A3|nr:uncharacterized protein JN550_004677 [Neoarthrinium moseri]KAI1871232.1 hypothetical protein JN550_004677 [Neoarthrinium moseri]